MDEIMLIDRTRYPIESDWNIDRIAIQTDDTAEVMAHLNPFTVSHVEIFHAGILVAVYDGMEFAEEPQAGDGTVTFRLRRKK